MSTLESLLPIFAGKAWRSATELVSNPDLLHAAQEHVRNPEMAKSMSVGNMPTLPRGFSR